MRDLEIRRNNGYINDLIYMNEPNLEMILWASNEKCDRLRHERLKDYEEKQKLNLEMILLVYDENTIEPRT